MPTDERTDRQTDREHQYCNDAPTLSALPCHNTLHPPYKRHRQQLEWLFVVEAQKRRSSLLLNFRKRRFHFMARISTCHVAMQHDHTHMHMHWRSKRIGIVDNKNSLPQRIWERSTKPYYSSASQPVNQQANSESTVGSFMC